MSSRGALVAAVIAVVLVFVAAEFGGAFIAALVAGVIVYDLVKKGVA